MPNVFHSALRRCETLWSAREIASMAPSAEQARHAENVFHIALRPRSSTQVWALCSETRALREADIS